jgi:hypothetical protein
MYDRTLQMGKFPRRPARPGGPVEELPEHQHGGPVLRRLADYLARPPEDAVRAVNDEDPYA